MKKILAVIAVLAALGAGTVVVVNFYKPGSDQATSPPVPSASQDREKKEFEAFFAIFTLGTFRVFTDSMYHGLSSDVFIEAAGPNVVHVEEPGTTWGDFFETLPFSLTKDCLTTGDGQTFCTNSRYTLKFYLNEKLDPSALNRVINEGDKLLISYGDENEGEIKSQFEEIPGSR